MDLGRAQENSDYLLVADVARGDGLILVLLTFLMIQTMTQVAEYQGKITPDMFAPLLFSIAQNTTMHY